MITEGINLGISEATSPLAWPPWFTILTGVTHSLSLPGLGGHLNSPSLNQMISKSLSHLKSLEARPQLCDLMGSKYHPLTLFSSKEKMLGDAGLAQWLEHLTLDFNPGHDLRVMRSSPMLGSTLGIEPA